MRLLRHVPVAFFAFVGVTSGSVLLDITSTGLKSTDPTQLGRISRDGITSDWSTPKAFPGVFNPTTVYNYEIFTVNVGATPYIQVSFDDPATTEFVSAYRGSYN